MSKIPTIYSPNGEITSIPFNYIKNCITYNYNQWLNDSWWTHEEAFTNPKGMKYILPLCEKDHKSYIHREASSTHSWMFWRSCISYQVSIRPSDTHSYQVYAIKNIYKYIHSSHYTFFFLPLVYNKNVDFNN